MKRFNLLTLFVFYLVSGYTQDIEIMDGIVNARQKADHFYEEMAYSSSRDYYQKALKKNKGDVDIQLKLARCYTELDEYSEALSYYEIGINSTHATSKDTINFAETLLKNGEYQKATALYKGYLAHHPNEEWAQNKLSGIQQIENFYKDSARYQVTNVVFNSDAMDFAPVYYQKELLFLSNRPQNTSLKARDARSNQNFMNVYQVQNDEVRECKEFNNNLHEGPMTFFDNGNKLLITANHTITKSANEQAKLKLVILQSIPNGWAYHSDFPYNNPAYSIGHPTFDETNQVLYFSSNQPEGKGGADLYTSSYMDGKWSTPQNLAWINTERDELFPFYASNNTLYFASSGWEGLGGLDIYFVNLSDAEHNIKNPGYPINTSQDDYGLILMNDGELGYLSSNRIGGHGKDDIYKLVISVPQVELPVMEDIQVASLDSSLVNESSEEIMVNITIENLSGTKHYQISKNGLNENGTSEKDSSIVIHNLFFDFDSDDIPEGNEALRTLSSLLATYAYLKLEIRGYSDPIGDEKYNDLLAEKRAKKVMDFLVTMGVNVSRLKTVSIGEYQPVNECGTPELCTKEQFRQERRVEFSISQINSK